MALGSALSTARNSLKVTSGQVNVVSQNIAGARDPDYTRRTVQTHMGGAGSVYGTVRREADMHLLASHMAKTSESSAANTIATGAKRLSDIYSGDDFSGSPARLLADFRDSAQLWYNQYDQPGTGEAAISRAKALAESLNRGSQEIAKLRHDADQDIKASVDRINTLLDQFHDVDQQIVSASAVGHDSYAYMDQRDAILKQLSEETGVTSVTHADGTMSLYGMDGSTLYDKTPRKVTFSPAAALPAGQEGAAVYVDGVPLSHSSFRQPDGGGNLGGLLRVRDDLAPQYQKQLDEIAVALRDGFSSVFQDGGTGSDDGLSGRLIVNSELDPEKGGNPAALGGREKVLDIINQFSATRDHDGGAGIAGKLTVIKYAENSISWIETRRQDATSAAEYRNTMFMRSQEALSNETGVNTDDEMALMLQLEQTYSATAKIISTVGKMMDDLMAAI